MWLHVSIGGMSHLESWLTNSTVPPANWGKWCLGGILAFQTYLMASISFGRVCCLSCTLSSTIGMAMYNIQQWEQRWCGGHHSLASPSTCGRTATSHEGQKGAYSALSGDVELVDRNKGCEHVLRKFLQAKGLGLFRWARVRRDVWEGNIAGQQWGIQRICLSSSLQDALVYKVCQGF